MSYLNWQTTEIDHTDSPAVTTLYQQGFVFTRLSPDTLNQTRSLRIDLSQFELSSENRRILRKTETLLLDTKTLPLSDYHWELGKMAKDFYDTKFGKGTFSANKVKEVLTTPYSFNTLYTYTLETQAIGYAICYQNDDMVHYSYPFYALESDKNTGMGMMLKAIVRAKEAGKQYIYLGSAQRPTDSYKLQFAGLEWFDGNQWTNDLEQLKTILKAI